ncbi:MAG: HAD family hydrolase [Prevotella sp.]|nr:HAD family hydrolase [Prevotella sp.]
MIKGYIIDFGGTLDTNGCHWGRFLWHAFQRRQVPVSWDEFREAYVHVERLLGKGDIIKPDYTLQQTLSIKIRLEMQHLVGRGYWYSTPLELERYHTDILHDVYSRVGEQLEQSRQVLGLLSAEAPVVLCSNYYGNLNAVLQEFQLDSLFATVVESAAVGIRKPDAAIYEMALQSFGGPTAAPEVVVVGDSLKNDILPAAALGCPAVWLKGEPWDYSDADGVPPSSTRIITDLKELLQQ